MKTGTDADGTEYRRYGTVLGFAIEEQLSTRRFRLVKTKDLDVLSYGTLEDCERELISRLETVYGTGRTNVPAKTLGGMQFWEDLVLHGDWRLQRHVYTGHCRLLDQSNVRRAWGTLESCRTVLEKERFEKKIRWPQPHLVVLIHGLGRSKHSLARFEEASRAGGFAVANLNYPSTRRNLAEHADQIGTVLENLQGIERISFVTHSLGGIVVRKLLSTSRTWQERIELGRVVMLAPPNQGSVIATYLRDWLPFQWLMGEVGQELTREGLAQLPEPPCEFGVIAGGSSDKQGLNPLLPGDNDMVVCVDNTKLPGSTDFLLTHTSHTFMMNNSRVIASTLHFLSHGVFDRKRDK